MHLSLKTHTWCPADPRNIGWRQFNIPPLSKDVQWGPRDLLPRAQMPVTCPPLPRESERKRPKRPTYNPPFKSIATQIRYSGQFKRKEHSPPQIVASRMAGLSKLKKNSAMAVTLAPEGGSGHFLGSLGTAQNILTVVAIYLGRYPDKTCCQSTGPFYWFTGILGYFLLA